VRHAGLPLLAAAALLAACAAPRPAPPAPGAAPLPREAYRALGASGARLYRLDGRASLVLVLVDPAGRLARLGHRHVVAGGRPEGLLAVWPGGGGEADLYLAVPHLRVDAHRDRLAAGGPYAAPVPAEDARATRSNMLKPGQLDAGAHPWIHVRAEFPRRGAPVRLRLSLRGVTRSYVLPVAWASGRDGRLTVSGRFTLRQTDFGIRPYQALGGALRVADRVRVRFRLVARPLAPAGSGRPPPPAR